MTKLIIKGAVYFSADYEAIIKPLRTGEFWLVDCEEYLTKQDYLDRYAKDYFNENKNDFITYEGVKYYYAGYRPLNNSDFNLLSDLEDLSFDDDSNEF